MPKLRLSRIIKGSRPEPGRIDSMSGTSDIKPRDGKITSLTAGLLTLSLWTPFLWAGECADPAAQAISVQGLVEVRAEGEKDWTALAQHDRLCPGDHLRVGARSRAALSLNDDSLLRLSQHSTIRIGEPRQDGSVWLDLLQGISHFISRVRHGLQVKSPYVNASIEGTEFTVQSGENEGSVSVLEGLVRASNDQGELLLNAGQRALARAGEAPRAETMVDPLDAVQWALYYPPVVQPAVEADSSELNASYSAYRAGDLAQAFTSLAQLSDIDQRAELLVYRAALLLRIGGVEAADKDLNAALKLSSDQPDALALKSIIASVNNQRQQAIDLARQALQSAPASDTALIALSYALQGNFQLTEALEAADAATQAAPDNALAWSRLAELQLMFRQLNAAMASADRAAAIDPNLAQVQTTLGFARLIRLDLERANQAFARAASLDQAAPLPRLGLGLVLIRQGDLAGGRQQIETAANLDPGNALIRSYLGKAYYEEKRDERAASQFELAKGFDELDPTAWFYSAILKQSRNRPQAAMSDLQQAIALNDNRAVYRSRLLLDEDQAARNASLANIYDDLGFEQLAHKESVNSLASNPGNASAHRFLSDSYAGQPRHETARVSELLQYQMLSPELVAPVSPSASETNLLAFQGSGPSLAGYSEYNPLFNRQRLSAIVSGVSGSNNIRGQEIAVGGFTNRGMLSAGYYKESSDGYRENNDSEQSISNVFGQLRLTSSLSIQAEVKHRENDFGDLRQRFDPELFSTIQRRSIESDSSRLGINFAPNQRHNFLYSAARLELEDSADQGTARVDLASDRDQHEAQYLYKGTGIDLVIGAVQLSSDDDITTKITIPSPFPGFPDIVQIIDEEAEVNQRTGYAYAHLPLKNGIGVIGIEYVDLEDEGLYDEQKYNPKLGLIWDLSQSTQLRLAAFKTLRGRLVNNQTLAPTHVAGFNQLLDDVLGTQAKQYAIALDTSLGEQLYAGIELTRREATDFVSSSSQPEEDQEELRHEAYLSWPFLKRFALTSRYRLEDYEREYVNGEFNYDRPADLKTEVFSLELNYHHPSGLFGSFDTSHVSQEITNVLPTTGTLTEDGSFWIGNLNLGIRLPNRTGMFEISIRNLFDREFNYQSIHPGTGTPQTSPYYPERSVFANLQLWF